MIVVYVSAFDAEKLLTAARRLKLTSIVAQLEDGEIEARLPAGDARPVLSARFEHEQVGFDIYDPAIARDMWNGLLTGLRKGRTRRLRPGEVRRVT